MDRAHSGVAPNLRSRPSVVPAMRSPRARVLAAVVSTLLAATAAPAGAQPERRKADPVGKPGTVLVTEGLGGAAPDGDSRLGQVSADASTVAFSSAAGNLVAGDLNGREDVFAWDRASGATSRVSVDRNGGDADGESWAPRTSADGRYVVYTSAAVDIARRDRNGAASDVFLRDRSTGVTRVVSHLLGRSGSTADGWSREPWISADGSTVVFRARAAGLVGRTVKGQRLYRYDVPTGKVRLLRSPKRKLRMPSWVASPDGRYVGLTRSGRSAVELRVWDRETRTFVGSCRFVGGTSVVGELSTGGRYFTGKAWQAGRTLLFAGSCDTTGTEAPVEVSGGLDATAAGGTVVYNYSPSAVEPVQDVSVVTRSGTSVSVFLRPPNALWVGAAAKAPGVSIDDSGTRVAYVAHSDTPIVDTALSRQAIYLWDSAGGDDAVRRPSRAD